MNHNLMDSLPDPIRRPVYLVGYEDAYKSFYEDFRTVDFSRAEHRAMFVGSSFGEVRIKKLYIPVGEWNQLRDKELKEKV